MRKICATWCLAHKKSLFQPLFSGLGGNRTLSPPTPYILHVPLENKREYSCPWSAVRIGQNLPGDHEGLVSSILLRTFQDRVWRVAGMEIEQLYEKGHFAVICSVLRWCVFHLSPNLLPMDILSGRGSWVPNFPLYTFPRNHSGWHILNTFYATNDLQTLLDLYMY